jgi:uncharacterized Zn-binding protein involved in type VI secretion
VPEVARKDDHTSCPGLLPLPHIAGTLYPASNVCVEADGRKVIRLADYADCWGPAPQDVVFEGSATFTICGLPVARKGDHMAHTGVIVEGSPHFIVGGPTFALPPEITIHGPSDFQNKVIRDMYLLSTTPSGQDMIDQIHAAGQPVKIQPESDPFNSFCSADNHGDSMDGTGTGSTVSYNPDVAIFLYDDKGNEITSPPQLVLGHEMVHALHNSTGTAQTEDTSDPDPNAPASQPNIEKEEAQTIGTGSWNGTSPTENSMRADLGLPRRDNHYGRLNSQKVDHQFLWYHWQTDESLGPTADMRPGDCG